MANNVDIIGDQATIEQIVFDNFSNTNGRFEDNVITTLRGYALHMRSSLTHVYLPNVTYVGENCIRGCSNLISARLPRLTSLHPTGYVFYGNTKLSLVDWGACELRSNNFTICRALKTLILRKETAIQPCNNTSVFTETPFASGGSGGTIYIPKALYDHLGDGTSLDYKAATNWATYDSYGTITWAQLEGSPYEDPDFAE